MYFLENQKVFVVDICSCISHYLKPLKHIESCINHQNSPDQNVHKIYFLSIFYFRHVLYGYVKFCGYQNDSDIFIF